MVVASLHCSLQITGTKTTLSGLLQLTRGSECNIKYVTYYCRVFTRQKDDNTIPLDWCSNATVCNRSGDDLSLATSKYMSCEPSRSTHLLTNYQHIIL